MHRKLTDIQIQTVCRQLLLERGAVSVRAVTRQLRENYGVCGRTERVAELLREARPVLNHSQDPADVVELKHQLLEAQRRAEVAEERERRHQDFWAARYQEKIEEWQRARAPAPAGVTSEQYLRLYVRAMELAQRLAQYEEVDSLLPPK